MINYFKDDKHFSQFSFVFQIFTKKKYCEKTRSL